MADSFKKANRHTGEKRHKELLVTSVQDEDKKSALEIADEIAEAMRNPSAEDRKRFLDYIN